MTIIRQLLALEDVRILLLNFDVALRIIQCVHIELAVIDVLAEPTTDDFIDFCHYALVELLVFILHFRKTSFELFIVDVHPTAMHLKTRFIIELSMFY